jgi:uncharacterized damage-inducible protein DinB
MSRENIAFCLARRKAERAAFVKVLKAVPQDRRDYKPDPRSRTAAELAWVIAAEEAALAGVLETGAIEWKDTPPPATNEEIVALFEKNAAAIDERLAKVDEAAWAKPAKFMMGGAPVWEDTVANFFWGFLFDTIHHRGQLSTYLRPMGSKVPAIYGPSADDDGRG